MKPEQVEAIMNTVPEGARVIAICVPTRALRVILLADGRSFRVEQLDSGTWTWQTRSSHFGEEHDPEWAAFGPAMQDAIDKQEELKLRITKARIAEKNARLAALNETVQ